MIQREAKYYTVGYNGKNPNKAPFYISSLGFDGEKGTFNADLIDKFNEYLKSRDKYKDFKLDYDLTKKCFPEKIIVVNASHDNLPASHETARVFAEYSVKNGLDLDIKVANTRKEILEETRDGADKVLIMSQCVDKKVYDVSFARKMKEKGAVVVPGELTAPGGPFSDKYNSYELLSDKRMVWDKVAKYRKIVVDDKTREEVVDALFVSIEKLKEDTGDDVFYIKPTEGGGGLGGFRVEVKDGMFIIPDLSKVSGDLGDINPTFFDIDLNNDEKLLEAAWIYELFSRDEKMKKIYLSVDLDLKGKNKQEKVDIMKEYLIRSGEKREKRLAGMLISREVAKNKLVEAISLFEKKFDKRYVPLVNEHIDFGLWGLRAHYRSTKRGPELESMYSRIFQLAFTEEGLGYLGADNISNKQTGELEVVRFGPVNEIMLRSIGGETSLFESLSKGVEALLMLSGLLPPSEKDKVPLRLQLDLAAVSKKIGEGNADTARGICLGSRWSTFVRNTTEWLEDSLDYYSWMKNKE